MEFLRGRTSLLITLAAVCVLCSLSPAPTRGEPKNSDAGQSRKSKVIIYPKPGETIEQLKARGIGKVANYGSYWVVSGTDQEINTLRKTYAGRVDKAEHLNRIELAAYPIDTTEGEPSVPNDLREPETAGKRLRLIQFEGPVQPQWLEKVKAAGDLKVVHYVPHNAYLLWLDASAESKLREWMSPDGPIQWIGAYHPYYKIPKHLRTNETPGGSPVIDVVVGLVEHEATAQTLQALNRFGFVQRSDIVAGQRHVTLTISRGFVTALSQLPDVLWVDKVEPKVLHDEVQTLITASFTNNTPGNGPFPPLPAPPGTNYLDWLTSTVGGGLPSFTNQFAYPIVDVADTGFGGNNLLHPAFHEFGETFLPSRVAYDISFCSELNNNFTGLEDLYGHGTVVATVLAGFDTNVSMIVTCVYGSVENQVFRSSTNTCTGTGSTNMVFNFPDVLPPSGCTTTLSFTCSSPGADAFVDREFAVPVSVTNIVPRIRQDASGFQLGMGISPFGQIGMSRIWNQNGDTIDSPPIPRLLPSTLCGALPPTTAFRVYSNGARIQNNSWSDGLTINNGGQYNANAQAFDVAVRDALPVGTGDPVPGPSALNQEFIVVFAGNSGSIDAGAFEPSGGFGDIRVTSPSTAKNVLTVGSSENVRLDGSGCAVVANQDNSFDIAKFSAFGPTLDGRFKPEIVAPGSTINGALTTYGLGLNAQNTLMPITQLDPCFDINNGFWTTFTLTNTCAGLVLGGQQLLGTGTVANTDGSVLRPVTRLNLTGLYECRSGSSFAAPAVSGAIQLLWWYFQNRLTNELGTALFQPSPAMAKAYLLNSARYLPLTNPQTGAKDTLPSTAQGMGILDLARMFDGVTRVIRDESAPRAIDTPITTTNPAPQQTFFSQSGQSYELQGVVASNSLPFRVTLAWSDAPGNPSSFLQLVNDLDLEVTVNGVTYKGNVFAEDRSAIGGSFDSVNNVESVFLPAGAVNAGDKYSVLVRAVNIAGDGVPNVGGAVDQDFALVVYNSQTNFASLTDVPNLATNNACQTAIEIPQFPFTFSNTLSTNIYHNVHPSPSVGRGGSDEFFKISLPPAGTLFTIDTAGSSFSNVLSVWRVQVLPQNILVRGDCGALVEVASDNAGGLTNLLSFVADGSNNYYIVVEPRNGGAGGAMTLNVTRTVPSVTITPLSIDFSNQVVGTPSAPVFVSVKNTGVAPVSVNNVTLGGLNPGEFFISTNLCGGASILPGDSCTIGVGFNPSVLGVRNAQLRITTSETNAAHIVALKGTGISAGPVIAFNAEQLIFPDQAVGTTSAVQSVIITNIGAGNLIISSITPVGGCCPNDFFVSSSTCLGTPIPSNGTCTINVQFTPHGNGPRGSLLQIISNAGSGTNTALVLLGTGISPAIGLNTTFLNFGPQPVNITSAPQNIVVQNTGNAPLTITSVTVGGTNSADFLISANSCLGTPIAPGDACGISVTFRPGALGPRNASLTIVGNATNSPQTVLLLGSGTNAAPSIGFSPTSLAFGGQPLGSTSTVQGVVIANNGNASLIISSIGFVGGNVGEFSVTNDTCTGFPIPPGGLCFVGAVFHPTNTGLRASTLRITSNSGAGISDIPVTGLGTAPLMVLEPAPVNFGTQAVSIASAPITVNVQSKGDSALAVTNVQIIGPNAGAFSVSNACAGLSVPPGSSCGLVVTFTPSVLGSNIAQMLVFGTATNSPVPVNLSGFGVSTAPTLLASPNPLNFPNQTLNTTSTISSITVSNSGNATLAIINLVMAGANPGDFIITNNLCGSIAPGSICTIGVVFRPTATGPRSALLQIFNNSGISPATVTLNGQGVAPVMVLEPVPVTFGTQAVSFTSAPITVNVQSTGDSALVITNVQIIGPNAGAFSVSNNCAGLSVPPGSSCGLVLTFTPSVLGSNTAQLLVHGNATNSPVTVNLSGVGAQTAPTLLTSPNPLIFPNQTLNSTSTVSSVTVSNSGNATLALINLVMAGANPGDFLVISNACGSVPPGGACTIGVAFRPTLTGPRSASLQIFNNSGISPATVTLQGQGVAPRMELEPIGPLSFSTQAVSFTSAPLTVNVLSTGDSALVITNVEILGTHASAFAVSNGCAGLSVPPGSSCGLAVRFTPSVTGSNFAQMVIYGNATNSPRVITLNGVGVATAPTALVTPPSLAFGNQPVNTTSGQLSVTVSNGGNAVLAIGTVAFSGGNNLDFIVTNNVCSSLAPGQTCTIGAVFRPTATGARTSTLQIFNNSGINPVTVDVTGNGTAPAMILQPNPLAFGTQAVSIASAPLTVNVLSVGDSVLTVTNVQIVGTNAAAYSFVNNCGGAPVPPGSSCGINVIFTPVVTGSNTAQLLVFGNATNSPQVVNLTGVGTLTAPSIGVTPASLAFGNQPLNSTSAVLTVTVTNTGNAVLAITNAVFSGGNAGDFHVTNNLCGSIPPGGSCTIGAVFHPSATGARASTLRIFSNSGINPLDVPVTGNGTAPLMVLSPTGLNYGTQAVSVASVPQFVFALSMGDAPLVITNVQVIGTNAADFVVTTNPCLNVSLPPGDSCGVGISFNPSGIGVRTAQLLVFGNATNSPQLATLTGIGATNVPAIAINPLSLTFPDQLVGTTGFVQQVTISNPGTAGLAISGVTFVGGDTGSFVIVNNTCQSGVIPAGGNCVIGIASAPKLSGPLSTTLRILSNAGNGTNTVAIFGSGVAPAITFIPAPLDFGTNPVGVASVRTLTVLNSGNAQLIIPPGGIILGGASPADYTNVFITCTNAPILPGQTCLIGVQFRPTATLQRNAQLFVFSNATNSPAIATLTGVGVPFTCPTITLSPPFLPDPIIGASYSNALLAAGGTPPYTFVISAGALPPGLTLGTNGVISGTATTGGTFSFTVLATDANGCSGSQGYTVSVTCPSITVLPQTLPSATAGTPYSQQLTAISTGGDTQFVFTVTAGALPPGLTLTAGGLLSGTPTTIGVFSFTVQAANPQGCTGTRTYTITVNCANVTMLPTTFPNGVVDVPYAQTNSVIGAVPPFTFFISSGSIPPGLSYSTNGVLSGTPTLAGSFNFTASALDANGCLASRAYTLTITCGQLPLVPATVPDAALGVFYSQTIQVSGRTNGVTFARTSGTMPPGLTISAGGVISGTPTLLGSFTFQISALDSANNCTYSRFYTIKVNCPTIGVSPAALPFGSFGDPYSVQLTATGGAPPYVFTQTDGALPFGMTLSSSGLLSGTLLSGSTPFTVTVTDSNNCTGTKQYTLIVANDCPTITVNPSSLPTAVAGQPYNQILTASGGGPSYTFSVALGSLPPGLTLSAAGELTGTPLTTGTINFTVQALDSFGCKGFRSYTLNVVCDTIIVSPVSLPTGTVTVAYSQLLTASNGVAPHVFTVTSGSLPDGLSLTSAGLLSGTTTNAGNFAFTVTATDAIGCTGSRLYSLAINPAADLAVTVTDAPDPSNVGSNITYAIIVTNRGPSVATSVVVSNVFSAGVTNVITACSVSGNNIICALGTLPAGSSVTITNTVSPTTSGQLTNTVTVSSGTVELAPANNTARAVTTVQPALNLAAATELVNASAGEAVINVRRLGKTDEVVTVEYATSDDTAVAGADYEATAGVLSFGVGVSERSIKVPLIKTGVAGRKTAKLHLSNPTGGAVLGPRSTAKIDIINSAKATTPLTFNDADGDVVTVRVNGAGMPQVSLLGEDVGPVGQITVSGGDANSTLIVTVKRGATGNGQVDIGGIAAGSLKAINAKSANLTGAGIQLDGALGNLNVNAIRNSAVSAATGIGVVNAKEISGSLVSAGFTPANVSDPMGGGNFVNPALIKSVKATAFQNSTIAAAQIGAVKLGTVPTDNGGHAFGVLARDGIGSVKIAKPKKFAWDRAGAADQAMDDFHVKH